MIAVISGTNRAGSMTSRLARHIAKKYENAGETVRFLDLSELPLELLSADAYGSPPERFVEGYSKPVLEAKGLVVVTPEYNGGFPGVLKLMIDHLPFPESFDQKPVAFVGLAAGQFGALRPVEQLQQIFGYRNAWLYNRRIFIAGAGKALNENGIPVDDALDERLDAQVSGFLEFIGGLEKTGSEQIEAKQV